MDYLKNHLQMIKFLINHVFSYLFLNTMNAQLKIVCVHDTNSAHNHSEKTICTIQKKEMSTITTTNEKQTSNVVTLNPTTILWIK